MLVLWRRGKVAPAWWCSLMRHMALHLAYSRHSCLYGPVASTNMLTPGTCVSWIKLQTACLLTS
jgi:hypothetical protein